MFSAGDSYERFMGRWSRKLAPVFADFALGRDPSSVLDVGCGTGALAMAVARARPGSRVTGIDPSAAYVERARRNANEGMTFEVGDAQAIPFADHSFDCAVSLLVLNFVPDVPRAVAEMRRVTRAGGRVAACVWDYGEGMGMMRVFWDEAVALDPAADAKDERHKRCCQEGELGALWRSGGLRDLRETGLSITMEFESFADYWLPFLEGQGPAGVYAAGLQAAELEALRSRLEARLPVGSDGRIRLQARAWAVVGSA